MGQELLILVGLFLICTLIAVLVRKYLQKRKPEIVVMQIDKHHIDIQVDVDEHENIPESHQSQMKSPEIQQRQKPQSQSTKKQKIKKANQLIEDAAFQFNDDSDNDNDQNSSGTEQQHSISLKEGAAFNFQQSEHHLEELVAPSQVNTQEN